MQRLRYSRYFKLIFILIDVVVIFGVFAYFFYRSNNFKYENNLWEENGILMLVLIFFWMLLGGRTRLYTVPRNLTYTIYLERLITHILLFIFGVILLAKISNNEFLKRDRIIIATGLFVILFIVKTILFFALKSIRVFGFNYRNVMFLSENSSTDILKNIFIQRKDYGFRIFDYPEKKSNNIKKLINFWKENGIHTLYLPSEYSELEHEFEKEVFREAENHKVRVALVPNIIQNNFFQFDLGYIETLPVLSQTKFPLDYLSNYVLKRTFDVIFSILVLLLICSWFFPIIALLIVIDSKGSVFFVQKRYGFHDEVFHCLKFRTMHVNRNSSSKTTEENDERITKIGKFLRKTSLDELPQFINVLLGDMSVVGPRPHMLLVDDMYKLKIRRYAVRSLVKPGVTGLAQVNGLRGDNGNVDVGMQKRIITDTFYVKNWSFSLDLVIILKTVLLVIFGDKNAK
ncbi:MAG: exopolysaccharide biosynthesis polyprenyl glycosylphosphotransferase [Flavobacteriaceae bacterium]|jgi:putative colanic acid biosynthesis UDP-glucose lipid carrier transferase|nr:exopolysaccharide biosynthesis polyprenyl glycosylphosphotransferase [Flavobacteriaceae bacterium]